jgi:uncharacterized protein (TIGR03435 family)
MNACRTLNRNRFWCWPWLTAFAISVFATGSTSAQKPAPHVPHAYDVCSVKPSLNGSASSWRAAPDGGFNATAIPALALVVSAFGVQPLQVSGLPSWAASDSYDVACKDTEAADTNDGDQQRATSGLQALLADRFRLQYHRADKPLPVTVLKVGKRGLKLTPSNSSTPSGSYGPTFVKAEAWSIAQLASAISGLTGERIVDQTGAAGRFDFDLQWKLEEQDAGVPPGAVVKRAGLPDVLFLANVLNERLGLTVTRQMEPTEVIIIDHIEKPAEN